MKRPGCQEPSLHVRSHWENHAMLFLTPSYHDLLYLTTELGALGLVLLLYWLTFRLRPHQPGPRPRSPHA
ncbi:hypothetical protein [Nodosilinea sp. FACHB-13]|uniref:hypothetical protein n=1 Tax=Cyanophyceae TaxID=3028117 RepID=UPI00168785E9|nr:hypothetical protein [Nodosilinea sp. FACHB-13]MBD2106398.1 hypothetical protein [Nodosilinea sp. FACHB-13]